MIKAIYEKMADKTLSFGCKIYSEEYGIYLFINEYQREYSSDDRIIGHPVMIGDCLSYFNSRTIGVDYTTKDILNFWTKKRKPIEEQSEECIEYIYNLIKY